MEYVRKHFKRILPTILLVFGIIAAFANFIRANTQRIAAQNMEYIYELTEQRAVSVDSLIAQNLTFIQSTAYLYGKTLSSPEADIGIIRDYEENSVFDMLRFVDAGGDNYTSQGVAANLSDRAYFQAGMRGESGTTYVLKSRVTGQKQIGFYAPVYYEGGIIGVMVGFYGEDYIQKLLEYELFGQAGDGWLCARDGSLLGSTADDIHDNFLTHMKEDGGCTPAELEDLAQKLAGEEDFFFTYREGEKEGIGYAVGLTQADWVLIRSFPPSASAQILENANLEGFRLITELIALFAVYVIVLAAGVVIDHRREREANQNANDISGGVSTLFEKFVTLDLDTGEYRYIGGQPDDAGLASEGKYAEYCRRLFDRIPEGEQRRETERFFAIGHLKDMLTESDRTSFRVHAPLAIPEDPGGDGTDGIPEGAAAAVPDQDCNETEETSEGAAKERKESPEGAAGEKKESSLKGAAERGKTEKGAVEAVEPLPEWYTFNFIVIERENDGTNAPARLLLVCQDVTELHMKEEAEQQRLQQALDTAERASRAKTEFLFNMSHDLRTPMNAIIGYTDLSQRPGVSEAEMRSFVRKIDASSRHLLALINDILEMSRIESGKLTLEPGDTDLVGTIAEADSMFATQMKEKKIDFTVDAREVQDRRVLCDKNRLNRVILNLLSNAYKFTPEGGKIGVRLVQTGRTDGKGSYELHVKDTGIGMSPDFVSKLFTPFERERTSTVSGIQGTGLGLSITKNIVDLMDGTIDVETEQGKGTEFIVRLQFPVLEAQNTPETGTADSSRTVEEATAGAETPAQTKASAGTGTGEPAVTGVSRKTETEARLVPGTEASPGMDAKAGASTGTGAASVPEAETQPVDFSKIRILLVEDQMVNREIAYMILSSEGFQVEMAEDGHIAVDMVKASEPGHYDLILMDIQMPTMNGYEATRAIRALDNEALAHIPIVAMTANAFKEDIDAAAEAGMEGHIAKPIDIPKMLETLTQILRKHGSC